MRSLDRSAKDGGSIELRKGMGDQVCLEVLGGTEVTDWGRAIDGIKLEVVPGKGMTYDGYDSLDACLRCLEPALRGCSSTTFAAVRELAKRRLGFS